MFKIRDPRSKLYNKKVGRILAQKTTQLYNENMGSIILDLERSQIWRAEEPLAHIVLRLNDIKNHVVLEKTNDRKILLGSQMLADFILYLERLVREKRYRSIYINLYTKVYNFYDKYYDYLYDQQIISVHHKIGRVRNLIDEMHAYELVKNNRLDPAAPAYVPLVLYGSSTKR
jgi:hypothetical protein